MHRRVSRRTVAKGAGILAGTTAAARLAAPGEAASPSTGTTTPEPSLYERLGGIFAIAAVVDRFSDAIIVNPKLNKNPALKAWNQTEAPTRLPGLKFMRTIWMAAMAGGPFTYPGLPLHEAHLPFHLAPEEFDEVGAEIVRALDYYKVSKADQQELVDVYMRTKSEVTSPSR